MLLKEIASSAKISWCPISTKNKLSLLALGGCGLNPCLSVGLIDITNNGKDIQNIGTSSLNSRCTSIAWGSFNPEENALGLICTGMEDGNMSLFKPILSTYDSNRKDGEIMLERICETNIYPSAVSCLEFNKTDHQLLASGGNDGKVYVLDLSDGITGNLNYYEPGKENKHGDSDVTALKWNPKVPHIMSSSSSNGTTAIWDLKMKKSAISFRDPAQRSRPSTLAWVPNQPTQIVVGYDDDRNPSLQLWDLRNVSYPFKEAVSAHQKGVMSIEFSPIDPNLLLSSGKDGKTICWTLLNNQQPEIFTEIHSQQWSVQNQWSPNIPGIFATASHNDKVSIYSLSSHSSTTTYIPSWYHKPCGVNFTFSGKLVSFSSKSTGGVPQFNLYRVPTNPEITAHADMFDQLLNQGDFIGYCQKKCQESESSNEKLAWSLVENMFSEDSVERRLYIASLLGFDFNNASTTANQFLGRKCGVISQQEELQKELSAINQQNNISLIQDPASTSFTGMSYQNSPTNMNGNNISGFQTLSGQMVSNQSLDPEKFFQQLGESESPNNNKDKETEFNQKDDEPYTSGQDYSSGTRFCCEGADNEMIENPFASIPQGQENQTSHDLFNSSGFPGSSMKCNHGVYIQQGTELSHSNLSVGKLHNLRQNEWTKQEEDVINELLVTGNIDSAIDVCVQRGFFAEALLLAVKFGGIYLDYVQKQYLKKHECQYTQKVLGHVIMDDLEDFVKSSNLDRWNETLAIISIYTQPNGIRLGDYSYQSKYTMENLSELLAKRLQEEKFDVRSALICYLCARNFRNSIEIWGNMASCQSSQIIGLQDFVEKVAILQAATRFNGNDENITKQVVQYAEILANSGRIVAAMKFLSSLASNDYSINSSTLRDRIYNAAPELMSSLGFNKPNFPFTIIDVAPFVNANANIYQHQQHPNQQQHGMFGVNNSFQSNLNIGMNSYPMMNNGNNNTGMGMVGQMMQPPPLSSHGVPPSGPSSIHSNQMHPSPPPPPPSSIHSTINNGMPGGIQTQCQAFRPGIPSSSGLPPPPPPPSTTSSIPQMMRPSSSLPSTGNGMMSNQLPPPPSQNMAALTRPSSPNVAYSQNNVALGVGSGLSSTNQGVKQFLPQSAQPPPVNPPNSFMNSLNKNNFGTNNVPPAPIPTSIPAPSQIPSSVPPVAPPPMPNSNNSSIIGGGMQGVLNQGISQVAPPSNRSSITTAPHSGATPPIPGMPVPWPLPTATQQLNSTTSTTANANKQIQEASKKNNSQIVGKPLSGQLLDMVTNVVNSNLNSIFANDPRKKMDAQKRFDELFENLRVGNISETVSSKVVNLCQALQTGDYLTANKIHIDLSSTEWENNKNWLMAFKRIIPK
ncbi:WD repeat protein [Cryptosporidium parvum Iowa II]|uniref:WD repeat protein n=2 Tax=Cryptosporidium parvum TaxID=5807 RepID=Q5CQL4_CRYPI|nr:WD repeat protein [Cryptosporidium parvum Iowa II]EAK87692.1 WD repeat protein [Cryptosporidium parvum Iowa II]QOY41915.1 WD40-repeat-containing protein [Cryptosporidium parvum]WKS77218.1 WD repeat protein [Cryptosporidium sp. 43IA8]WRK32113.1 WD40-repeat-containing protein [Cryptosporidium parvum]|eukprot:QOY41915.1 hypothetical protein CPATCC_001501 [Cryptosporidium parvum]